jgi:hypothetical protein
MGDENGEGGGGDRVLLFLEGKSGRRRVGSTMLQADDTVKSGAMVGEAMIDIWRLKMTKGNLIGGPNTRLGQTAD